MLNIFVFIDIWFVKQDIQKWLKKRYAVFYGKFENEKKKKKKIDLPEREFKPQIFSNFPRTWFEGEGARSNQNKFLKKLGLYLNV